MAIITKIRNQSALLIGTIGIAMLFFIVGGDFLGSGGGIFGKPETDVLQVRGEDVSFREFDARVRQELVRSYGSESVEEQVRDAIRERIWSMMMHEKIMFAEYDAIGLSVSAEELFFQIKSERPSPVLTQYFTNPQTGRIYEQFVDPQTGGLNSQAVMAYLKRVFDEQQTDVWLPVEEAMKMDRLSAKYFNLIKKGLYVTGQEAQQNFLDQNTFYDFSYVMKRYEEISDDKITVEEKELQDYYEKNRYEPEFQQRETTRSVEYVVFRVIPTPSDSQLIREDLRELKEDFAITRNDTFFVQAHAENPEIRYAVSGEFPAAVDSLIMHADTGTVVGPYMEEDFYKITKVMDVKFAPDSAKARHILISITEGDTASALAKADSLKQIIRKEENFPVMALQHSEDPGSAQEGGDLDWFREGTMVAPFNKAVFEGKPGDMPVVVSQFGVHLIEILEHTPPVKKVLAATIDSRIEPGKATFDAAFNKASAFSINNNTTEKFREAGEELGIREAEEIMPMDNGLPGLPDGRDLIRWVYEAEKGAVSKPFELDNNFVVVHLHKILEKSSLPLEAVANKAKEGLIKEKKADLIRQQVEGMADLSVIAQALEAEVDTVTDLSFSAFSVPGIGPEPKVIGTVAAMQENQTGQPLKGNAGVFIVKVNNVLEAPEAVNLSAVKRQKERTMAGRVDFDVFNALKEEANIVDNRHIFY